MKNSRQPSAEIQRGEYPKCWQPEFCVLCTERRLDCISTEADISYLLTRNTLKGSPVPKPQRKNLHIGDTRGPVFEFEVDGVRQQAHKTWYRGENSHFNPSVENMQTVNAVADHVLAGWVPPEPSITHKTNIVAFGSCFAEHITSWLAKSNFNVLNRKDGDWGETYIARFGEGMVNSHAILQQFEWALEGKAFTEELWHDKDAASLGIDEAIRLQTQGALMASDFFIITLGLAEVWSDKASGDVFWRAVPEDKYDPAKHEFRVTTHGENLENLNRIYQLIRKHRPSAKIMFTLSPIPLVATFRPVSSITANAASKAILRAALDEFLRAHQPDDADLHYWPSYEIAMDVFANRWSEDRRHIKPKILEYIMTLFEHTWCTGTPQMGLTEAWVRAQCAAGALPKRINQFLEHGEDDKLEALLANRSETVKAMVKQAQRERKARLDAIP